MSITTNSTCLSYTTNSTCLSYTNNSTCHSYTTNSTCHSLNLTIRTCTIVRSWSQAAVVSSATFLEFTSASLHSYARISSSTLHMPLQHNSVGRMHGGLHNCLFVTPLHTRPVMQLLHKCVFMLLVHKCFHMPLLHTYLVMPLQQMPLLQGCV